jgi:excisionase family DNA binding protein
LQQEATMTDTTKSLATVAEVADYLALSRSKVYQLMESGELPYIKLGKCRRVFWKDVQALLTDNRVGRV